MKIGLLGGSFDPIHLGHLKIARTAAAQLHLKEVWFIPTAYHPLKGRSELLAFEKRVELIKEAIEPFHNFKLSRLDSNQTSRNYTYNLIKRLTADHRELDPVFIIGSDILTEITKWYKYDWLLKNVSFAVIKRPGMKLESDPLINRFQDLVFINMESVAISSSEIRELIKQDQSIHGLVPASIEKKVIKYYKLL